MLRTTLILLAVSLPAVCLSASSQPALDDPPVVDEKEVEKEERPFDLMVGDPAPEIHVDEWLTGEPTTFEQGKVTLLQFWASWTSPSLFGFEELTELQKQYQEQGLQVLGLTREDERGNRIFAVKELIKERAEEIGYRTGWDREGKTYARFMTAAGYNKIPFVFLIDRDGRIAFCGFLTDVKDTLEQVMAGKFDTDAAAREYDAEQRMTRRKRELELEISVAMREGRQGDVLLAMDKLLALGPKYKYFAVNKFHYMIKEMDDPEGAYKWALQAAETHLADDPYSLNSIAYSIVIMNSIKVKDLDVAMALAVRANEIEEGKDGQIWNTIGTLHYHQGDLTAAVEALEKAVEFAPQQNQRTSYERTLNKYREELEQKQ